jgi:hypothetical protein
VDGADEERWTRPLVVRIERVAPPHHTDVLEAVAKACLAIGDDERAAGEWAPAFSSWLDGRFRKVVRRARGAHWFAAGARPGVTVVSGTAEVRAFPPAPNETLPPELRRLQVGGTDLADPAPPVSVSRRPAGGDGLARMWSNPGLTMTTGKAAAQAGHAAMLLRDALLSSAVAAWREAGYPLVVRPASVVLWADLADVAMAEVADGGFTEIAPGSVTMRAEAP